MARTAIEGGCKLMDASSPVDTIGYGKVTILTDSEGAVVATGGDTLEAVADVNIAAKIIDPTTGAAVVTATSANKVMAYIGDQRFIQVTGPANCHVLLSEPRSTN